MQPLVIGAIGWNLLLLATGLFLVYTGFKAWRFSNVIRNTATASPGSVAAGRAEVEGVVQPDGEPIEAPFTGEACVCLDWTLEEHVDGVKWSGTKTRERRRRKKIREAVDVDTDVGF